MTKFRFTCNLYLILLVIYKISFYLQFYFIFQFIYFIDRVQHRFKKFDLCTSYSCCRRVLLIRVSSHWSLKFLHSFLENQLRIKSLNVVEAENPLSNRFVKTALLPINVIFICEITGKKHEKWLRYRDNLRVDNNSRRG